MNNKDFYNHLRDKCLAGDRLGLLDVYKEYQISHCYYPKRMYVFDSFIGKQRLVEVPCGSCYHCRETSKNNWVSRAYYHLDDYKYCYFVTLTYRSFHSYTPNHPSAYLMDYLAGALWHYDSLNTNHTPGWNPCILYKPHYQNFIKRLRKNTGNNDITYMLSGETGKKFGRPHFHLILFSKDKPILKNDVLKAWSLKLSRHVGPDGHYYWTRSRNDSNGFYFSLGRVSFDDLVTNGTITNQTIYVDGQHFSAKKCFSYVCKYLHKDEFNVSRYKLAFDSLYSKFFSGSWSFSADGNRKQLVLGVEKYHLRQMYEDVPELHVKPLKLYTELYGQTIYSYPSDFDEFTAVARPFFQCSLATPIGSLYLKSHWSEISKGQRPRPSMALNGSIFPNYFSNKVKEAGYPFRRCNPLTKSRSFVKGNVPSFLIMLHQLVKEPPIKPFGLNLDEVDKTSFKSSYTLKDNLCNYYLLGYIPSQDNLQVVYQYRYSRASRSYVFMGDCPLESFFLVLRNYYESYLPTHETLMKECANNLSVFDECKILLDTFSDRFYSDSPEATLDYVGSTLIIRDILAEEQRNDLLIKSINSPNSVE